MTSPKTIVGISPKKDFSLSVSKRLVFSFVLTFTILAIPNSVFASPLSILEGLFSKKVERVDKNSQTISLPRANLSPDLGASGGGDITIVGDSALLPDAGPLGTSADIVDENLNDQISIYVVRKGDTISGIAKMFRVSPNTIIWANDIVRGVISEGQTLVILPISGIQYTVKAGDTPKKIADKYKADIDEVLKFNGISLETKLNIGEIIIIPDAESQAVASLPDRRKIPTSRLHGTSGPYYEGYFIRPVIGGYRSQGLHGYNGVDIAAFPGAPIVASATGDVILSRQGGWNGGYGNYIVIRHNNGTQTLYAHLRSNIVSVGERVMQGQVIGYMGSTGKVTGNHLHFEVRGAKNPF